MVHLFASGPFSAHRVILWRTACTIGLLCSLSSLTWAGADKYGLGDGHSGALSVTTAGHLINAYTALSANANAQATTISVANGTIVANNDLIMIWQTAKTLSPAPTIGDSSAVDLMTQGVGHYEFGKVASTTATTITLTEGLILSYASPGAQIIRVPEYTTVTIAANASIVPQAWNGSTGGIVVLMATGALTINAGGSINATGAGFRGGARSINSNDFGCVDLSDSRSGARGESISLADYGVAATQRGRGNVLQGGGGGNCNNAGGAGGGHMGAGGKGGRAYDPVPPGPDVGGIGGAAVAYGNGGLRITMGGGGGGAQQNNNNKNCDGSAGGGAILLRAASANLNSGNLVANGAAFGSTSVQDGGGGGGAGGYVEALFTGTVACATSTTTYFQGNGANGQNTQAPDDHGAGGGGGGGIVLTTPMSDPDCTKSAAAGANGVNTTTGNGYDSAPGTVGSLTSLCGNGIVEAGEFCDDGNLISGDGCSSTCTLDGTPLFAAVRDFTATQYQDGTLLEWSTTQETENLGFYVYRELHGQLTRLTPSPIPGALLLVGRPLSDGRTYRWVDHHSGSQTAGARYLLESWDVRGLYDRISATPLRSGLYLPATLRTTLRQQAGPASFVQASPAATAGTTSLPVVGRTIGARLLAVTVADPAPVATAPQYWNQFELPPLASNDLCRIDEAMRTQQSIASSNAWQIVVPATGWYRVSREALVQAGLPAEASAAELALFSDGKPVAFRVIGEPAAFSAIEFYGLALDSASTQRRSYWLTAGSTAGERIRTQAAETISEALKTSFPEHLVQRERTVYIATANNGFADNFFGAIVTSTPVTEQLATPHVSPIANDALLTISIFGLTESDHQVVVSLNGESLGTIEFAGRRLTTATFALPPSALDPLNAIGFQAQGGAMDSNVVRSVKIDYTRELIAEGNALRFVALGGQNVEVRGLETADVMLHDVTDPSHPVQLTPTVNATASGFSVRAHLPGAGRRFLTLSPADGPRLSPSTVVAHSPSSWHEGTHQAGLVIVTHEAFASQAQAIAELRRAQGWSVAVVDIDDVFAEFSFGNHDPWALRCFVRQTQSAWTRRPSHWLLLGDASFDPENLLGQGAFDFVPTQFFNGQYMEFPTDDWFVDLNDDNQPELAIGRLSVRTSEEADNVVRKLRDYDLREATAQPQSVLLIADNTPDDPADFMAQLRTIGEDIPQSWSVFEVEVDPTNKSATRTELLRSLQNGVSWVDYFGHGSVGVWSGNLLRTEDALALANEVLPFVVSVTCLNGFFHDVYAESLAEALVVRSPGGAIAMLASSTLSQDLRHHPIHEQLIRTMYGDDVPYTLGAAVRQAKTVRAAPDWILFGDPTLQLKHLSLAFDGSAADPRLGILPQAVTPVDPSEEPVTPDQPNTPEQPQATSYGCAISSSGSVAPLWIGFCLILLLARSRRRKRSAHSRIRAGASTNDE